MRIAKSRLVPVFAGIAGVLIIGVWLFYAFHFYGPISSSRDVWGQFGDYFGGVLNPILSFGALLGLIFTLQSQQQESDKAEKRHREQLFDSRLFQLLSLSHDAVASIKFVTSSIAEHPGPEFVGHRAVAHSLNRLQENYLYKVEPVNDHLMYEALYPQFLNWKRMYWSGVASYVESMLYVLWFAIDKAESVESSSFALRAVFAQMSADEKLLIFYVMIFTPRQKMLLHGQLLEEFLAGASQDDLLLCRTALLQSAMLVRLTPQP
ncbi:hypothetical protein [Pseudomonas sp. W5-01]|uniref:hypothetical protein n=1 Tax=Pseudomonas sp. W5-01 TaxID=3097454 RepID=UPI00397B262B